MHCPHASPLGDGQCGSNNKSEGKFGNCESYCALYEAGCSTRFIAEFGAAGDPRARCSAECATVFAETGADTQSAAFQKFRYTAKSATSQPDSLACHAYFAVKALGESAKREDADVAKVAGFCNKVPTGSACGP